MLKQAIPNIFVKDFQAALAYYTGPLGFHPFFVFGDVPFYAHVARDKAILAIRHVTRPVIDPAAGEALLSAFIEVSDVDPRTARCKRPALIYGKNRATSPGRCGA